MLSSTRIYQRLSCTIPVKLPPHSEVSIIIISRAACLSNKRARRGRSRRLRLYGTHVDGQNYESLEEIWCADESFVKRFELEAIILITFDNGEGYTWTTGSFDLRVHRD